MKNEVTIISTCEKRENKDFETMSKRLVHSIRTNGGKYKDVDIVMWHCDEAVPSDETKSRLSDTGCTVVEGKPFNALAIEGGEGGCEPVGNKIMAVNTPVSTEYSLWMDADMYVLDTSRFEALLDMTVDVAAAGAENTFHRWARLDSPEEDRSWAKFYELAGIDPPSEQFVGGLDGEPCNFYFNSALVFFKNGRGFPEAWADIARLIRASGMPHCAESWSQTSLTVAAVKTADTTARLPSAYNGYWSRYGEKSFDQVILHYQDQEHAIRKIMGDDPRVKWDI
jgi:hypothetical protein